MLVTQVEMLLSNADRAETTKMLDWLNSQNRKFLFDSNERISYGFRTSNVDWSREDIRVESRSRTGPFIDLRYTLRTYDYPHALAHVLRNTNWKIKAKYRQNCIETDKPWSEIRFSGLWTYLCDPDFPRL
jgi:hypothetical protein